MELRHREEVTHHYAKKEMPRHGKQGSHHTSAEAKHEDIFDVFHTCKSQSDESGIDDAVEVFIKVLVDYDIQISMDGKDRALDNIRIERLWRSLKYEDIYLKRYETMKDLKAGINAYFNFYNTARFHQSLDYNVPDEMYKCFQYNELERKRAA